MKRSYSIILALFMFLAIAGITYSAQAATVKSVKLSTTTYTYDGKAKKPSVIAKNSSGKTISSKYYTVTYPSGRKNVGSYKVTVKFKGNYKGTKTPSFKIIPKATSISSIKSTTSSVTVTWAKKTAQTTGYQVQYSTSSKMSSPTTVTISKNTTVSKKITAKANKKYYVRVRTYKTVGKTKYYSKWTSIKNISTCEYYLKNKAVPNLGVVFNVAAIDYSYDKESNYCYSTYKKSQVLKQDENWVKTYGQKMNAYEIYLDNIEYDEKKDATIYYYYSDEGSDNQLITVEDYANSDKIVVCYMNMN